MLHIPSSCHSDEGGQSPEGREDIREDREKGGAEIGRNVKNEDNRLLLLQLLVHLYISLSFFLCTTETTRYPMSYFR